MVIFLFLSFVSHDLGVALVRVTCFRVWGFVPTLHPLGTLSSIQPPSDDLRSPHTHEVDQPTNRLPHGRAFRGRSSRRSQSIQCKGEHGQQQPCNVHPPRKSTTSTCSGAIPRRKVCSASMHALLFHHNAHREHARGRTQPVLGLTRVLAQIWRLLIAWIHELTCPLCVRRKHLIDTEQWYECSEPADDPVMTCILAPEWMDLADETWLCSDALKSEDKRGRSSYGEDSY